MEIPLNTIYIGLGILSTLCGFVVTIWITSSKFSGQLSNFKTSDELMAKRLTDIENELRNEDGLRRKIDERLDDRLSSLDRRVQGVETKIAGFEAKVDTQMSGLKEGIADLKKLVMDRTHSN